MKLNKVIEFSNKPDLYILTIHADNLAKIYYEKEIEDSLLNCIFNPKGEIIQAMRGWTSYFSKNTLNVFYKIRFPAKKIA